MLTSKQRFVKDEMELSAADRTENQHLKPLDRVVSPLPALHRNS